MSSQPFTWQRIPLGLLAGLVSLDVAVRLLEKVAVVSSTADPHTAFAVSLLKQPCWWLGLALGPLQLWIWTRILSQTDLSFAYPVSSISYPLTMMAAQLGFGEQLNATVWIGAFCIVVGVAIVGSARPHGICRNPRPSVDATAALIKRRAHPSGTPNRWEVQHAGGRAHGDHPTV